MRDPREAIQLQISSASSADVIIKPVHEGVFSQPMDHYVGTKACVAVEHAVKTDSHRSGTRKSEEDDGFRQLWGACKSIRISRRLHYWPDHLRFNQFTSPFLISQKT